MEYNLSLITGGEAVNAMLSALADVCRREVYREKILVVPAQSLGHQLLEALSFSGVPWLNACPATAFDLAELVAARDLFREGRDLLTTGQTMALVEEALAGMAAAGELKYFTQLQETGDLGRLLHSTVQELRLAGLTALGLNPCAFVSPQKGRELKRLLALYESCLRQRCLADQALVFRLALQVACSGRTPFRGSLFIIPAEQEFPPLVHSFLARLSAGARLLLPAEPVRNLHVSSGCSFSSGSEVPEGSLFSRLYEPPAAVGGLAVEIFAAYGAASELREVFRRLKEGGLPLDSAAIIHTSSETYLPLIYALASRLGLPVTYAGGLPVRYSRPGRLALQLLRWLAENYSSTTFGRILTAGDLFVPSPDKLARVLRRYRVGWGRDRYLPCLTGDDEGTQSLREIMEKLLAVLPQSGPEGLINYPSLASGLSTALAAFAHASTEADRLALEALQASLAEAADEFTGQLPAQQALTRLQRRLDGLAAGASGPRPGALHVASYHETWFIGRTHLFVVGLAAENFPGGGMQDPVLLDGERGRICRRFSLREQVPLKNTLSLARLLASHRGPITLSYPCYDPAEGRPASPSGLLLQAWRLASGNPEADYSAMLASLPPPVTYLPDNPASSLTADEWWMAAVLHDHHSGGPESVAACYPSLGRGLAAAQARSQPCFTPFDGLVTVDPAIVDPRQNPELVLSSSQLERLAACPFSYFLSHVLRVYPPDDLIFDAGTWLDNLSRGSLLHDIYCRYLRELHPPGGPAANPDKNRLLSLAVEMIDQKRAEIPTPGELVFEYESSGLLRDLEIFCRLEAEHDSVPAFFEVPFGASCEDIAAAGLGQSDAVTLVLPDGSTVRLRGRIDRIDRGADGNWEVWDFKTGSAYNFRDHEFFRQGRQLQHALYGQAAEVILSRCGVDNSARVRSTGYLFLTEKGEGQRFIRPAASRARALRAVVTLLNLAASGLFCATHDEERCHSCDYKMVCRTPSMGRKVQELLTQPELAHWKELQDYD